MIYGYARVSSKGQQKNGNSLADQDNAIHSIYPDAIMYSEAFTGKTAMRPQFQQLLNNLHDQDTLVVTKLDRFCRSTREGLECIDGLLKRGIRIHILNMGVIDDTPIGKLLMTVLLAFAEYEREMISERMSAGKEYCKENKPGWTQGRKKIVLSDEDVSTGRRLIDNREATVAEICERFGISKSTWLRRVREAA